MNRYTKKYNNLDEFCKEFHTVEELLKWYKTNKVQWPETPKSGDGNDKPMAWPDHIIKFKIGNCWDHAMFMHYFCERNNINHAVLHIQVFVESEKEYWPMGHAIGLYQTVNGWNFFNIRGDYLNSNELGPYKTIDEAIKKYIPTYSNMIYTMVSNNSYLYKILKQVFWTVEYPNDLKLYDKYYNNHKVTQNQISEDLSDPAMKRKYGMRYPLNKSIKRLWIEPVFHGIKKWISDYIGKPLYQLGLPSHEDGLMGISPVIGMNSYPFVMQIMSPTFVRPKYGVQNDLITDKIITTDEDDNLKVLPNTYLSNKKIKLFKYKGKDPNSKWMKIFESLNTKVPREFIYETISGKNMLTDNQLYLDEDFEEIKFEEIKPSIENEAYTVLNKFVFKTNPTLASKYHIVQSNEALELLNHHSDKLAILESDEFGYFAVNKDTLRRTKYYDNIKDIVIGEDLENE